MLYLTVQRRVGSGFSLHFEAGQFTIGGYLFGFDDALCHSIISFFVFTSVKICYPSVPHPSPLLGRDIQSVVEHYEGCGENY